jgi:hypothetical protein
LYISDSCWCPAIICSKACNRKRSGQRTRGPNIVGPLSYPMVTKNSIEILGGGARCVYPSAILETMCNEAVCVFVVLEVVQFRACPDKPEH